jgi:serine/threonine-protein kinase
MMRLLPREEAEVKARQAAMKALELDETLSEAHVAMASVRYIYDEDWSGAEEEFNRAIKMKPGNAEAYADYGWFLIKRGRMKDGLAKIIRALELNPLSERVNEHVAWAYVYNREYDEAIAHCLKALQLNPNFSQVQCNLAMAYFTKGLYEETIATLKKVDVLALGRLDCLGYLGSAYALLRQDEKALKLLEELKARLERGEYTDVAIAQIYVSLDEKDKALTMLERRGPWLEPLILSPVFDPLRSEPRFQALLKEKGLKK